MARPRIAHRVLAGLVGETIALGFLEQLTTVMLCCREESQIKHAPSLVTELGCACEPQHTQSVRLATPAGEHVDGADLGQYAALLYRADSGSAGREFPPVRDHLAGGCKRCERDLREILAFLREQ